MAPKRVIIIGGGPAGLSAAYELLRRGKSFYEVIVLEAGPTVGGLECNYIFGQNIIDVGGHCFDFTDDRVREFAGNFLKNTEKPAYDYKIIEKIKPSAYGGADPDLEDDVMIKRRRCESFCKGAKLYPYPLNLSPKSMFKLSPLGAVPGICSHLKYKFFPLREQNIGDFYINSYGKNIYDRLIAGYAEKVFGQHPAEVLCIKDVKEMSGLFFEKRDKKAGENYYRYPKYGAGQLWIKVAEKIKEMGGFIFCNCPVLSLTHTGNAITSVHYFHNGAENDIDADIVISSAAIKDLLAGFVSPPPEDILKASEKLFYRDMQVVGLLVRELKPKAPLAYSLGELLGEHTIYFTDTASKIARMQIYNNRSPYMVGHPHSTVCLGVEIF
ncbi:MAG: FAD-dependent oxidoreductase, partial [Clostridia bacterium]|nr:FAD-dependent oxidoreductase [Clostridia bacterium]